jgi:hypothetical protein
MILSGCLVGELVSVKDLVAEYGAAAQVRERGIVVTDEGEYGALVILEADGREVAIAVVYGDDDCIVQTTPRAGERSEWLEGVLAEVKRTALGLSPSRDRRYVYCSPGPDWHAIRDGQTAIWVANDSSARLEIMPARLGAAPELPADLVGVELVTAHGLHGRLTLSQHDDGSVTELASLSDGRWGYLLHFHATAHRLAEHRSTLERVLDSILPVAGNLRATGATLAHWSE